MTARLVLTTLAVWLIAVGAQAQSPSHLREAEEAYLNVEFEQVRDHALEALRGGRLTPDQLVRTYELLGVASSALHETDVARDYFVRMLGIDPDHELDASVNPEMRDPFLEARGMWAARWSQRSPRCRNSRSPGSIRRATGFRVMSRHR